MGFQQILASYSCCANRSLLRGRQAHATSLRTRLGKYRKLSAPPDDRRRSYAVRPSQIRKSRLDIRYKKDAVLRHWQPGSAADRTISWPDTSARRAVSTPVTGSEDSFARSPVHAADQSNV